MLSATMENSRFGAPWSGLVGESPPDVSDAQRSAEWCPCAGTLELPRWWRFSRPPQDIFKTDGRWFANAKAKTLGFFLYVSFISWALSIMRAAVSSWSRLRFTLFYWLSFHELISPFLLYAFIIPGTVISGGECQGWGYIMVGFA